jgi:hypothetical protein
MIPEMDVGRSAVDHLIREVVTLERAPDLRGLFDKVMLKPM